MRTQYKVFIISLILSIFLIHFELGASNGLLAAIGAISGIVMFISAPICAVSLLGDGFSSVNKHKSTSKTLDTEERNDRVTSTADFSVDAKDSLHEAVVLKETERPGGSLYCHMKDYDMGFKNLINVLSFSKRIEDREGYFQNSLQNLISFGSIDIISLHGFGESNVPLPELQKKVKQEEMYIKMNPGDNGKLSVMKSLLLDLTEKKMVAAAQAGLDEGFESLIKMYSVSGERYQKDLLYKATYWAERWFVNWLQKHKDTLLENGVIYEGFDNYAIESALVKCLKAFSFNDDSGKYSNILDSVFRNDKSSEFSRAQLKGTTITFSEPHIMGNFYQHTWNCECAHNRKSRSDEPCKYCSNRSYSDCKESRWA